MSIRGPEALAALDAALSDIRHEEDDILRKLGRGLERVAKIRDSEGELLRQFAAGRLPEAQYLELTGEVTRAGLAIRAGLQQRATEATGSAERRHRLEKAFVEEVAARAAALAEIDRQQGALRTLSPRIAAAIARDPSYERQRQVAADLKETAAAARAKSRQAELDREQKSRPFRDDKLFGYLLASGYGTPAYRGRGLGAWLDAWVAKLARFDKAAANYALLNEIPARLRAHAEQQAVRAAAAEDRLDELERAAIDAAGGAEIRAALTAAQQQAAAIDAQLLGLQDERDRLIAAQTQLTASGDDDFELALCGLVRALGSADIGALIGKIRAGGGEAAGPFVTQLDDARLRIAEAQADGRDQHARLATLATRRRDLEDIEFELKARHFDDPRSVFRDDDLIGGRLDNFLTGAIGPDTYWTLWRSGQAWSAGTSDWGGGVGLPRHGRDAGEGATQPQQQFSRPRTAAQVGA